MYYICLFRSIPLLLLVFFSPVILIIYINLNIFYFRFSAFNIFQYFFCSCIKFESFTWKCYKKIFELLYRMQKKNETSEIISKNIFYMKQWKRILKGMHWIGHWMQFMLLPRTAFLLLNNCKCNVYNEFYM